MQKTSQGDVGLIVLESLFPMAENVRRTKMMKTQVQQPRHLQNNAWVDNKSRQTPGSLWLRNQGLGLLRAARTAATAAAREEHLKEVREGKQNFEQRKRITSKWSKKITTTTTKNTNNARRSCSSGPRKQTKLRTTQKDHF